MTINKNKDEQGLRRYAFKLLGRREYSVFELTEKLKGKTDNYAVVDALIVSFVENDWVSDTRFCEGFVRDQILKKNGPAKIRFKSKKYGLDSELLDQVLSEWYPEAAQLMVLEGLAQTKTEKIGGSKNHRLTFEEKGKLMSYLSGKGFSYDLIKKVLS